MTDIADIISRYLPNSAAGATLGAAVIVAGTTGKAWLDRMDDGKQTSTARKVIFFGSVALVICCIGFLLLPQLLQPPTRKTVIRTVALRLPPTAPLGSSSVVVQRSELKKDFSEKTPAPVHTEVQRRPSSERGALAANADAQHNSPVPAVPAQQAPARLANQSKDVRFAVSVNADWCTDVRGTSYVDGTHCPRFSTDFLLHVSVDGAEADGWTAKMDSGRHLVSVTGTNADPHYNAKLRSSCSFYVGPDNDRENFDVVLSIRNTVMRDEEVEYNIDSCEVN